jgi:type IV pilus assembly protein PilB
MGIGPSLEDLLEEKDKKEEESTAGELSSKIKEITIKEKEVEAENKSVSIGLPYINLVGFATGPDAITTLTKEQSIELKTVCFLNNGQDIRLGTVDYTDAVKKLEGELKEKYHAKMEIYLISQNSFDHVIKLYDSLPEIREVIRGIEIKEEDLKEIEKEIKSFKDLDARLKKASISELVTVIIAGAIKSRSSDIHIEAEEADVKVRYRIDGVLNDVAAIDKDRWPRITSRIKQLAKLKINVSDRPQDGRFSIFLKDDRVDVRVSALPTGYGESIVIRLLISSAVGLPFEELGLRGRSNDILNREITRPNGMIITTGPTGSGKTTTLYAILNKLNDEKTKIITLEDPIEYELKGVNQSQVGKNYTFGKGLRSIVRQDPDIIMVGEIRDLETAEIAIQSALTGHLVLSTIHTNDAFGTVPRFMAIGAKPFLLAPALNVAIGQRLVRRNCEKCKKEVKADPEHIEKAKKLLEPLKEEDTKGYEVDLNNFKFFKGEGCDACQGLGYKGRVGIYEIMPIEGPIQEAVTKGNLSEGEIKKLAVEMGVISMVQDGLLKALEGITSIDEVFRVAE